MDGRPWAFQNGTWLFSMGNGQPLGYFSGRYFYAKDGTPMYFEQAA